MMNEKIANLLLTLIRNKREEFDFDEDRKTAYFREGDASATIKLIMDEFDEENTYTPEHFFALLTIADMIREFEIPKKTILDKTCQELFTFLKNREKERQEAEDEKFAKAFQSQIYNGGEK